MAVRRDAGAGLQHRDAHRAAGDFITLIGLLALSRAATLLAGLESGFGFGGAAAARDVLFSVFAEAALAGRADQLRADRPRPRHRRHRQAFATGHVGISVSLGFALVAMLAVALTETGRIPVDNPAGHLELAMVHEALLLEYSGRYLAAVRIRRDAAADGVDGLIGTIFLPFGMARADDIRYLARSGWCSGASNSPSWPAALPVFEISTAKMRVFRVPEFLGVAMLLGVLAGVFLFVAARIGG